MCGVLGNIEVMLKKRDGGGCEREGGVLGKSMSRIICVMCGHVLVLGRGRGWTWGLDLCSGRGGVW